MTPLELEQWVLVASDPTFPKHREATTALQAWLDTSSPEIPAILLGTIESTQHQQVLFYTLTTFVRYSDLSTVEQRTELARHLLSSTFVETHLRTKAAVVLAHLIQRDFPQSWTTALDDLRLQASPDLLCRSLQALLHDSAPNVGQLKDAMRGFSAATGEQQALPQDTISARIMTTLLQHGTTYQNGAAILSLVLTCLADFASWVDVSLCLEPNVQQLVNEALSSPHEPVGVAAVDYWYQLVGRGMDMEKKIQLLQETQVLRQIFERVNLTTVDASPILVVIQVAKFIDTTGQELVEHLEPSPSTILQQTLWPQLMELFFKCLCYDDIDVSGAVLSLASRLTALGETYIQQLLPILHQQMKYPATHTFDYEDDEEAEEEVYRQELRKLYTKCVRVSPELCLRFTCEACANLPLPLSSASTTDAEAALRLVFHYCEGIRPPPGLKRAMKQERFVSLLQALHESDIDQHANAEVLLLYYDTAVRYYPLYLEQPQLLPKLLESISGRGLHHSQTRVRSRSSYLLLRLIKSVIKVMPPYVETGIQGIQGLLSNATTNDLRPDDALYLFETIGLLVGKTGMAPDQQQAVLTRVIAPHIQSMETLLQENVSQSPEQYGEILSNSIAAIAYLSKGFSNKAPPQVQVVLGSTVGTVLRVFEALPQHDKVRSKCMIFLQRMIQCIGAEILPSMPRFLLLLIEHCTVDDIQDVAQLLNQLCIKFREKAIPALDPILLLFLQKCHVLAWNVVGETNSNDNHAPHVQTEHLSVQKLAYTVLQHVVVYRLSPVLVSPTNASSLEQVLETMSKGAIQVDDAVMKKSCLTFFRELVDQWAPSNAAFINFVLQVFCGGMFQCILSPSFNEKDALQARNVTEFANILFLLKMRVTDQFNQYIVGGVLTNAACPPHILQAYQQASNEKEMEQCLLETMKLLKSS